MEKRILNIIANVLDVDINEIELDTAIGDLPEWDSIDHLQIIAELEKEVGIKYTPEELAELEDISDLISLTEDTIS